MVCPYDVCKIKIQYALVKNIFFVYNKIDHKKLMFYDHVFIFALIAQLVEQLPFKQKVAGSNPAGRTYFFAALAQLARATVL